jgi:hypothetical protein
VNNVIINSNIHKNIKVCTGHGKKFGENIHFVPVIADELRSLMLEFPCCLLKNNQTGQFGLYALLGFEPGENLFLTDNGWNSHYIPLHIRRQPFMVGRIGDATATPRAENTVLTIDMDSLRVKQAADVEDAQALFDDKQKPTSYLTSMSKMLFELSQGMQRTEHFIQVLADNDLIEPIQLNVTLNKVIVERHKSAETKVATETKNFDGLYVINEKKLARLSGDLLAQLHKNGYLQACYLMMASIGQIQKLIQLRNSHF